MVTKFDLLKSDCYKLYKSLVTSTSLYCCETWTLFVGIITRWLVLWSATRLHADKIWFVEIWLSQAAQVSCHLHLFYGCETWALFGDSETKTQAFGTTGGETSPHFLPGGQDQRLGAEQDQLPCRSTAASSGICQKTDTCIVRACHTQRQPLQNDPSWHLGELATPWSAEEMLDGQH